MSQSRVDLIFSMMRHREYVKEGMHLIKAELERRALVHDLSKYKEDEYNGFAKLNSVARNFAYGSPEYIESMKAGKEVIDLHFSRNSHHPEYNNYNMGWLDIIEMVVDWRAAWKGYESGLTWEETVAKQRERFQDKLGGNQWWLVEEIAKWVEK